jgi:hypothetical protein
MQRWGATPGHLDLAMGVLTVGGTLALSAAFAVAPLVGVALLVVGAGLVLARARVLGPTLTFFAVLTSCASGIDVGSVLTLPDVFLLPAAALAVATALASHARLWVPTWLILPAGGILFLGLLSGLLVSVDTYRYLFQFVGFMVLVPFTVAFYSSSLRRLTVLTAAYLASATINAGLAVLDAQGISHLASRLTNFTGYEYSDRYTGLSNHSNQLGLMCVMGIPLALYFAGRWKPAVITVGILVLGAASSGSRGALLGLPLAFALYILITRRHVLWRLGYTFTGLSLGVGAAVSLGLSVGVVRLFEEAGDQTALESDMERLRRFHTALNDLSHHPITGVGYHPPEAHNLYLELARSGGIIAAVLFMVFAIGTIRSGLALSRVVPIVAAPWAAATAWLLLAVQHNALYERFLYVPSGLIVGAAIMSARRPREEDQGRRPQDGPIVSRHPVSS